MREDDNLVVIQVTPGSAEYSNVIDKFLKDVGKMDIVKVRINFYPLVQ